MEIYVSRSENFRVRVFQKEIDDYSLSVEQGVGFRADYRGKVGYAYVETLDEESVNVLVEGAKAMPRSSIPMTRFSFSQVRRRTPISTMTRR